MLFWIRYYIRIHILYLVQMDVPNCKLLCLTLSLPFMAKSSAVIFRKQLQQTVWTQIRLFRMEQTDLCPNCLQVRRNSIVIKLKNYSRWDNSRWQFQLQFRLVIQASLTSKANADLLHYSQWVTLHFGKVKFQVKNCLVLLQSKQKSCLSTQITCWSQSA